jgi:hypothetical protein
LTFPPVSLLFRERRGWAKTKSVRCNHRANSSDNAMPTSRKPANAFSDAVPAPRQDERDLTVGSLKTGFEKT